MNEQSLSAKKPLSTRAILSLLLGLVGLLLPFAISLPHEGLTPLLVGIIATLAIVAGHLAFGEFQHKNCRGRRLAIAGLVSGYIALVSVLIVGLIYLLSLFVHGEAGMMPDDDAATQQTQPLNSGETKQK